MPSAIATAILGVSTGVGFWVVSTVVAIGIQYAFAKLLGDGETETIEQGILSNKISNNDPIPVIYGYRKVGGHRIYQTVNNGNQTLWMAFLLGEGEIHGVRRMWLDNDEIILDTKLSSTLISVTDSYDNVSVEEIESGKRYKITSLTSLDWSAAGGPSSAKLDDIFTATADRNETQLQNLGGAAEVKARYAGKCQFVYKAGTPTQTAVSAADFGNDPDFPTEWGSDKRLFGLAYIFCKFTYDKETFRGIPNITADVKGIKVPDIMGTITNRVWDRNPAAILYDYLTNETYGRGLDAEAIDLESFKDCYETCDTSLTISGDAPPKSLEYLLGLAGRKQYTIDGVINVSQSTFENTKKILAACRGFLVFTSGKYSMVIDRYEEDYSRHTVGGVAQTPAVTPFLFQEDNIIGVMDITLGDKSNTFNRARYTFSNPQKNWEADTAYFDDDTTRDNSDKGVVLEQNIRLDLVSSKYCALEIVRQNLRQSRQQIIVSFQSNLAALANKVGDIVDVTYDYAGWELKQFRILRLELKEDGKVAIVMSEYDPQVYDPSATSLVFEDDAPDTNLPNPFATSVTPEEPTVVDANLSGKTDAGTSVEIGRVKATWSPAADAFIDYYELQYAALDQEGTAVSDIVSGSVYKIVTTAQSNWSSVGGPSVSSVGALFLSTATQSISSLGTVKLMTEDSAGYSTVVVPSNQVDSSSYVVEYIENLSPTTGYAFRVRFVRTNAVYSEYSPVQRFLTAGVTSAIGSSYLNAIEVTSGNPEMQDNSGTVTYKSYLVKGGQNTPDMGDTGSEINSYDWFYVVSGGTKTQITNANKEAVTGTTANNSLGGAGTNYNASTLTVDADGTALGTTGSGSATFSCEIDYTPT
jgi:hypothetical protein